ncbi:uncharacterized protein LOC105202259 [Solenopsis invicta]|uniref:uncharacterized protein LOC105202259 n=1 Tax=Solenopsis invicta TaxID=13686 RepID=UPI0005961B48|nr:uncharacterized protein LOC105202259 [Solenopsis invicta]XP_039312618.1 uncharacterized protein LOC105202259 [Solenopsis invicta]
MTERGSRRVARTSLCLLAALVLFSATSDINRAHAYPLESLDFYGAFVQDTENSEISLVDRLQQLIRQKQQIVKQENEISNEEIEIEAILGAKAREREHAMEQSPQRSGKRNGLGLCTSKIGC